MATSWQNYPHLAIPSFPSWLIVKCKFAGSTTTPAGADQILSSFITIAGTGTGNLLDYYFDVSYSALSLNGSTVYPNWLTMRPPLRGVEVTESSSPEHDAGLYVFGLHEEQSQTPGARLRRETGHADWAPHTRGFRTEGTVWFPGAFLDGAIWTLAVYIDYDLPSPPRNGPSPLQVPVCRELLVELGLWDDSIVHRFATGVAACVSMAGHRGEF